MGLRQHLRLHKQVSQTHWFKHSLAGARLQFNSIEGLQLLLSSSFLKQTFPVTDSRQLVVTSSSVIMYLLHVSMADPGRFFGCLSAPPPLSPKSKNVYISHPSVSEAEDAPWHMTTYVWGVWVCVCVCVCEFGSNIMLLLATCSCQSVFCFSCVCVCNGLNQI